MTIAGERKNLKANCDVGISRLFASLIKLVMRTEALALISDDAREHSRGRRRNLETSQALNSAERNGWSMKTALPAAELKLALNEAMRRRKECAGVEAIKVFECASGPANWDAEFSNSDAVIHPSCKRAVLATKLGMQNRFDLAI